MDFGPLMVRCNCFYSFCLHGCLLLGGLDLPAIPALQMLLGIFKSNTETSD